MMCTVLYITHHQICIGNPIYFLSGLVILTPTRMGSVHDNRLLYPKVLKELGRVCRESGRAVLLTHDNKTLSRVQLGCTHPPAPQ